MNEILEYIVENPTLKQDDITDLDWNLIRKLVKQQMDKTVTTKKVYVLNTRYDSDDILPYIFLELEPNHIFVNSTKKASDKYHTNGLYKLTPSMLSKNYSEIVKEADDSIYYLYSSNKNVHISCKSLHIIYIESNSKETNSSSKIITVTNSKNVQRETYQINYKKV